MFSSNNRKEDLDLDPRSQSKTIPQSSSHSQQIEMNAHRVIMRKRLVLDPHLLAHFGITGFLAIFRLCCSISAEARISVKRENCTDLDESLQS